MSARMSRVIFHLLPATIWLTWPSDEPYRPDTYGAEGFIHCTGDVTTLLRVANAFYRSIEGEVVALVIDDTRLAAEVKWERPPGTDPLADTPAFPHVYGPLELDAVVAVRPFEREPDGRYVALRAEPGASS
jgi:uncharacterized protein (DUF952 family)